MEVKIGDRIIGKDKPCFIIAEAGVNHNGKIALAKKLIDAAVKAEVDAVKFQTAKAEDVVTKEVKIADYARKNINKNISQLEMIKQFELHYDDFKVLKDYCDKKGLMFLSTPHSMDAIDFLEDMVPAYKFGSGDITNIPALKYAAMKKKPMILGTGMSTLQEVKNAVNAIKSVGNNEIVVLHCTTSYPCEIDNVNLRAMQTLKNELGCLVGYSDHSLGITVPIMAASFGAVIIEKHFTLDRNLPGPDHKASLEPLELKSMVEEIRNVEKALGSYEKKPTDSEKKIKKLIRKSIVAKSVINKGDIISENMVDFKRPGTGLSPLDLDIIVGKKAKRTILKDEIFKKDMVE